MLSPQIRIAALNASSAVEDDPEGTLKSHKSQTKEAQVTRPAGLPARGLVWLARLPRSPSPEAASRDSWF